MDELIPVIPLVDANHRTNTQNKTNTIPMRDMPQKNISFAPAPGKKLDPDVKRMMETSSSDFNVTSFPHKKTEEEIAIASTQGGVAGTSSWVIIVMAIVVILLICAIVYLVLKYNETCEPPPDNLLDALKRKRCEVVKIPPQLHHKTTSNNTQEKPALVLKPSNQNLTLTQQQAMQNQQNQQNQQKSKGTKEELLKVLHQNKSSPTSNIEAKLTPVIETSEPNSQPNIKPLKMPDSEKPTEADSAMISEFYHQMDMQVKDDEQLEKIDE